MLIRIVENFLRVVNLHIVLQSPLTADDTYLIDSEDDTYHSARKRPHISTAQYGMNHSRQPTSPTGSDQYSRSWNEGSLDYPRRPSSPTASRYKSGSYSR